VSAPFTEAVEKLLTELREVATGPGAADAEEAFRRLLSGREEYPVSKEVATRTVSELVRRVESGDRDAFQSLAKLLIDTHRVLAKFEEMKDAQRR
jgi:hypothetical protein